MALSMDGKYDLVLYGLGVMGENFIRNFARKGYRVIGVNRTVSVTERFAQEAANEDIARRVGRVVLVTSAMDVPPAEIGIEDLEVVEAPKRGRYPGSTAVAASRAVGKLLRDGRFNVVHDTFAHLLPLFWCRRRHAGQVFVTSLYMIAEWELRRWIWPRYHVRTLTHRSLRLWFLRVLTQRAIIRATDSVVVQAPGLVDRLTECVPSARSKVAWIPNNVVGPRTGEPERPANDRQAIELLCVGGFGVAKGADHLLTLLARARSRDIPLHATAVGMSSPLEASHPVDHPYLRRRIEEEGLRDSIDFHMRVDRSELESFYAEADWLFHVSSLDGSPRVVLEALMRGVPVIGSMHPGVTVLDPDDAFTLFVERFDADSLLDRLVAEKADPRAHNARAEAGRVYVEKHFSSDAVSERYVDLYSRLLEERLTR